MNKLVRSTPFLKTVRINSYFVFRQHSISNYQPIPAVREFNSRIVAEITCRACGKQKVIVFAQPHKPRLPLHFFFNKSCNVFELLSQQQTFVIFVVPSDLIKRQFIHCSLHCLRFPKIFLNSQPLNPSIFNCCLNLFHCNLSGQCV